MAITSIGIPGIGSIGFGGNRTQPQFGFSQNQSSSFGSQSGSQSSFSQSSTQSRVFPDIIWPEQAAAYQQLFDLGQQRAGQGLGGFERFYNQAAANAAQMAGPQTQENPALNAYANQLGRQFRNQVMPALRSNAIQAGVFGGSRAGVAQGIAGGIMGEQLQDFAGQQYQADQANRLAALGLTPALGAFGMGIPFAPLQALAQVYGPPTVLDQGSKTTSKSISYSSGVSSGSQVSSSTGRSYQGSRDFIEGILNPQPSGGGQSPWSGGSAADRDTWQNVIRGR